ncbi:MAG: glycosyltransferase [Bryobacteraceae bacterium]
MPSAPDLIKLVFLSGKAPLNQAVLNHFAQVSPDAPLYIVSEFKPDRAHWIPWHVKRGFRQNKAAIEAALHGRRIQIAAVVLASGTELATMRAVALTLFPARLIAYDENLNVLYWKDLPAWLLRRARPGPGTQRWLRRIVHPAEAEIPLRARLAQLKGTLPRWGRLAGVPSGSGRLAIGPNRHLTQGITVIIPTRDGRQLLELMLPTLLTQLSGGEVIVVDNGSSDQTESWLRSEYPGIRVIVKPTPLSFAKAINAGLREAHYHRTLLLNNDMLIELGFIAALETAFDKTPNLFCATAEIFFPPGVRREETGKAVWRRENSLDFPVRCDDPIPGEDLTWVLYGSGGCSLFDTAKLLELGGVSEVYDPAYVEDMDLGYRAWKRGWPSVFCAGARVEHRHRATTSRFFSARQLDFFVERNYLRFLIHAIGSPALFRQLWKEAIRRLQLLSQLDVLRDIPPIGPRPPEATGSLTEPEILALGNGDSAVFPGRQTPRGSQPIVIASPYLPYPLSHGGAVRIFNLMKRAGCDLVLIAFCEELATPPQELLDLCREVILVRRHGTHYRLKTDRPDMVEEFDSATFPACLKQTIERWKPALVQLEFTWMAQYAGYAKTILVEHDITFDLQRQLLARDPANWELKQQLEKWKRFETEAWSKVDGVVTMSAKDAAAVSGAKSVVVIPNGVDCDRFQPIPGEPEPRRLLFIGSFAHLPNRLALEFFLKEVWPALGPAYTLHVIAGPRPGDYMEIPDQPGVEIEGFVEDVRPAYARAEIVLAPLTASAGTNIKVLEAMAMGRVVVSTPAGINGLDLEPGRDLIVTTSASEMAQEIRALAADPARRQRIEIQARQTALQFDWSAIGKRQAELYAEYAR